MKEHNEHHYFDHPMSDSTPRYGHAPIKMKRVANKDDVDNVGEFAWSNEFPWGDEGGVRYITLALPRPTPEAPDNYIVNHLPVAQGSNTSGKWGWDGNEDAPTLTPSIHCIRHWHGWVRNGEMVEA